MRLFGTVAVVMVAVAAGGASAEDVPNPEFVGWAKFKPGTSVTLKSTERRGGLTNEVAATMTLVEVGDDKLVIEIAIAAKLFGIEGRAEPVRREVPKTVAGTAETDGAADRRPEGAFEEGTETLTIAGSKVETTWYRFRSETDGVKSEGTVWISDDVPAAYVKQTLTVTTATATSIHTTEVTEFKRP